MNIEHINEKKEKERNEKMQEGDIKYIIEYMYEYKNDIYNYWDGNNYSLFIENFEYLVYHKFSVVQYIWKKFISCKLFDKETRIQTGEEINKKVQKFDKILFSKPHLLTEKIVDSFFSFL